MLTALVLWSYKNELIDEEAEERDQTIVEAHTKAQRQNQVPIKTISNNSHTKIDFSPVM